MKNQFGCHSPTIIFYYTYALTHTHNPHDLPEILPGHRGFSDHVKDLLHSHTHIHTCTRAHTNTIWTLRARNLLRACPYRTTPHYYIKSCSTHIRTHGVYTRVRCGRILYTYVIYCIHYPIVEPCRIIFYV